MTLRAHQKAFDQVISGIIAGSGVTDIVAHVCPGGGKSTLAIQAGRLIKAGLADKICWIAPRASLQDQAERNFIDPYFRRMFQHDMLIRSSTNDHNPTRGMSGFVSTYQAIAVDNDHTVLNDFARYRYILVLDEFHHLADDGEWTMDIDKLYRRAAYRVLMTGTLSRGDEKKIAFVPYIMTGERESRPCFDNCENTDLITYTRQDALADQAIIPLEFHFADGVSTWQKESGKVVTAKLSTTRHDSNQALYTALKTEYAQELLAEGIAHWQNHRKTINRNGSLLVVAASIEAAKEYTDQLKRQGLHAEIATSDDTVEAVRQIKALKAGKLKILVTVAMAYEGLDVPSISHIICLTNVRSMPWIEQMVARSVRIDPLAGPYSTQKGYIFAPADRMFVELARKIEQDQTQAVAIAASKQASKPEGSGGGAPGRPSITPLSSKLIQPDGQANMFFIDDYRAPAPPRYEKTQREIERELRETIDDHVKAFCRIYCVKIAALNRQLKEMCGKPRENMTVKEMEALLKYLLRNYEIPKTRQPGVVLSPVPWR